MWVYACVCVCARTSMWGSRGPRPISLNTMPNPVASHEASTRSCQAHAKTRGGTPCGSTANATSLGGRAASCFESFRDSTAHGWPNPSGVRDRMRTLGHSPLTRTQRADITWQNGHAIRFHGIGDACLVRGRVSPVRARAPPRASSAMAATLPCSASSCPPTGAGARCGAWQCLECRRARARRAKHPCARPASIGEAF